MFVKSTHFKQVCQLLLSLIVASTLLTSQCNIILKALGLGNLRMLKVLAWNIFMLSFETGCNLAFGFLILNTLTTVFFTFIVAVYYFSATIKFWSVKLQKLHFYVKLGVSVTG